MGGRFDTEAVDPERHHLLATAPDAQFDRGYQRAIDHLHSDSTPAIRVQAIDTGKGLHEGGSRHQYSSGV